MNNIENFRYYFLVSWKLETFREYAKYIEQSLGREIYDFEESMKEFSDKEKEEFVDWHYDEIVNFRDVFPSIMRNSLFISVYSFLEEKIIDLCGQPDETSIKLEDLQGNGITRAALYIKKIKKEVFPDDIKEWHYIINANHIRNCIVHCGGDVEKSKNPKKVRHAIQELKHVLENSHHKIILSEEFCMEFISVVERFLCILYK